MGKRQAGPRFVLAFLSCFALAVTWAICVNADSQPTDALSADHDIVAIHMVSSTNGWALSRVYDTRVLSVLTTSDGGQTWGDVTPPQLSAPQLGKHMAALQNPNSWCVAPFTAADCIGAALDQSQQANQIDVATTHDCGHTWTSLVLSMSVTTRGGSLWCKFDDLQHGLILVESPPAMGLTKKE